MDSVYPPFTVWNGWLDSDVKFVFDYILMRGSCSAHRYLQSPILEDHVAASPSRLPSVWPLKWPSDHLSVCVEIKVWDSRVSNGQHFTEEQRMQEMRTWEQQAQLQLQQQQQQQLMHAGSGGVDFLGPNGQWDWQWDQSSIGGNPWEGAGMQDYEQLQAGMGFEEYNGQYGVASGLAENILYTTQYASFQEQAGVAAQYAGFSQNNQTGESAWLPGLEHGYHFQNGHGNGQGWRR